MQEEERRNTFMMIFPSEMGLVPISTWDCIPVASAVTATRFPV